MPASSVVTSSDHELGPLLGLTCLVLEDDEHIRSALTRMLVVRGASAIVHSSFAAAVTYLASPNPMPNVALIDLVLGDGFGLQLAEALHERECAFIVLTGHGNLHRVAALRAGAWAVLQKPADIIELESALVLAAGRSSFLRRGREGRRACERSVPTTRQRERSNALRALPSCAHSDPRLVGACGSLREGLTRMQGRVLCAMRHGLTEPEIAARLGVAPQTARKHTAVVRGRLGLKHNREAVARLFAALAGVP
jgi:DNA-binding NarL/FixJ family response regulator